MIDGEPYLRAVTVEVRDPEARPLSAADLAGYFSLVEVLDAAVQRAAQLHTPREWAWEPEDDNPVALKSLLGWAGEQAAADERAALAAARAAHDRRRITPDTLRQVLDIHAAKGIEGVMDEMRYSERNARRLLARARKELPCTAIGASSVTPGTEPGISWSISRLRTASDGRSAAAASRRRRRPTRNCTSCWRRTGTGCRSRHGAG